MARKPAAPLAPPPWLPDDPAGIVLLCLAQLRPSPLNPRKTFDAEALQELADSIDHQGLLENLVVRRRMPLETVGADGRDLFVFDLVSGERRYRAFQLLVAAGRWDPFDPAILCKIMLINDDGEHLALALIENLQRQDVSPIEEGEAFAQLQRMDKARWSGVAIAEAIGAKPRYVQQRLQLVKGLAPDARQALEVGKVNFSQARVLAALDFGQQGKALQALKAVPGLTADQLRDKLFGHLAPAHWAIFDVAASGLDTVTDDRDKVWFTDREAFHRAQKAAAQARAEELGRMWAWAKVDAHDNSFSYDRGEGDGAGVLIVVDWRGKVTEHKGLIPRPTAAPSADVLAAQAQRQHLDGLCRDLRARLVDRVRQDQTMIFRLLLLHMGTTTYYSRGTSPLTEFGGLFADLAVPGLADWLDDVLEPPQMGRRKITDVPIAFAELLHCHDEDVEEGLSQQVAHQLDIGLKGNGALHPVVQMLCRYYGIAIPPELLGGQADIEDAVNAATPDDAEAA